jgi:hypothetical protein
MGDLTCGRVGPLYRPPAREGWEGEGWSREKGGTYSGQVPAGGAHGAKRIVVGTQPRLLQRTRKLRFLAAEQQQRFGDKEGFDAI